MKLKTILYKEYEKQLPQSGKHILCQSKGDSTFVYQAFKNSTAEFAVNNQKFGGPTYSFDRMTWIKPNFLWMMYRSGWAAKEGQENILAIEISKVNFEKILKQAVHSSYKESIYQSHDKWKEDLANSEVRLQWDPDHGPNGDKLTRKAIQLGLRGKLLKEFNDYWILSIQNIRPFVLEQKMKFDKKEDDFMVIEESVLEISDREICANLELDEV